MADLVRAFEAKPFPVGADVAKTTVQVGPIRYRKCAALHMGPDGLYLGVSMFFRSHPTIHMPWTAFRETRRTRLYGYAAIELVFNEASLPSLVLYESEFARFHVPLG